MTDIVSDAREWLDGYAGRESTHSAECHKWHDACLIARLVDEIERLRQVSLQKNLTDAEREAVAYYVGTGGPHAVDATLSGLLSRTGSNDAKTGDDATECHSQSGKNPERECLTDEEREAVTTAMHAYGSDNADEECARIEATLWRLLERLK
jgi:hypothetical protein